MNDSTDKPEAPSFPKRGIGAQAAKKREELARFDQARSQLQEKWRQEREQLAKDVAEAEARDRRRQRTQEQSDQKRLRFVLGGLVLAALRAKGEKALCITQQDLDQLRPAERQLLDHVLTAATAPSSQPSQPGSRQAGPNDDAIDLEV